MNREKEGGKEREICKLHKFVVKTRRPRSHRVKYNMMRAEECLGRSRWIARSATNRASNVASLFVLPLFPLANSGAFG